MGITVKTTKGLVEGVPCDGYTVFRGIPYAKAPVGELRFRAPQEMASWEGVRQAKVFAPMCPQDNERPGEMYTKEFYADPDFMPEQSEDCLYLNVWVPEGALVPANTRLTDETLEPECGAVSADTAEQKNVKFPVALWIHGGAFMGGFGSELEFDGEAYAKRGVILVTINYRLGVFGFLNHPWLAAEDENGRCGNYGILDQFAALRWVRENIAAFGGDPENITVFGQSAGSMSTQTLLSSPLTKGMIHRAILQSGGGYPGGLNRDTSVETAFEVGEKFVELAGVANLAELRALPTEKIMEAFLATIGWAFSGGMGLPFLPVLDGYVMAAGYQEVLDSGVHPDIPYMLGSTADDIMVTPEDAGKPEKSAIHQGCIGWSENEQRLGRRPSYVYYFNRRLPGDENGAFHSSELWFMMGTVSRCWRPFEARDYVLSERMMDYWTNFMKNGDPNGEGVPEWKPCSAERKEYLVLE